MYKITTATKKIASLNKRIRAVPGGTSAGKTISILQVLIDLAQRDKTPTLTSVVSESFPHLKRGAIRDFISILEVQGYFKPERWNKTDFIYTFETGSKLEFFSADQAGKVRGPRRDRLFLNEANNISFETFEQLEVRTKEFIIMDWNPSNEFWYYTEVKASRDDVEELTLTYKDNEALSQEIVSAIEQRMNRKGWWQVFGLGQLGVVEGRIYKDWIIIDEVPEEARLERRGLDYGYSNDPTAVVDVYRYNGGYVFDEVLYRKGMSNKQIADVLLMLDSCIVVADSAEPKSNDEIRSYGIDLIPATKGPGSVNQGIQLIQSVPIWVTKRSVNLINEYRNYLWMVDKRGSVLNVPEGGNDHCVSGETLVYTTRGKKRIDSLVGEEGYLFSLGGQIKKFHSVRPTRYDTETLEIGFSDGTTITTTPEHLFLKENGQWIEAQLLTPMDLIQSVMYESSILSRKRVQALSWREIFQSWCEKITQSCLGVLQWANSYRYAYSSQGWKLFEQPYRQPRDSDSSSTPIGSHDSRKEGMGKKTRRKDKASHQNMALIKRGTRVAQATWKEDYGEPKTFAEKLCSLPYELYNKTVRKISPFLPSELQNESETKKVARIIRGRSSVVYNLEVEDTHCFLANGVIVHNCLDAIRYAISSRVKPEEEIDERLMRINENLFRENVGGHR